MVDGVNPIHQFAFGQPPQGYPASRFLGMSSGIHRFCSGRQFRSLEGRGKPGVIDSLEGDGKPGVIDSLEGDGKPGVIDSSKGDGKPRVIDSLEGDGKPG